MNIYTIYSESHAELFDEFRNNLWEDAVLLTKRAPQLCSGNYGSEGSTDFWKLSIDYFIEICEQETEPFLYADCDVMFMKDPTKDLEKRIEGRDLVAQLDKRICGFPQICTGIMCIRPTWAVKEMLYYIRDPRKNRLGYHSQSPIVKYGNDQKAINKYLTYHPFKVRWDVLPKTYYSINYDNGNKVWDGRGLKLKTRPYYAFHLNWTIGIENKIRLWELWNS